MIADPTVVNTTGTNGIGNSLIGGTTTEALSFHVKPSTVQGRIERSISSVALITEQLASCKLTIQHTPTNQGRVRSLVRVDASGVDAGDSKTYSCSSQLVIDQPGSANGVALNLRDLVLRTLLAFLLEDSMPAGLEFNTRAVEFLDGEA